MHGSHYEHTKLNIPVLAETDVVVIGGSFAGLACAEQLTQEGLRVFVVEPRTYLGREMTAVLRPWIEREAYAAASALSPEASLLDRAVAAAGVVEQADRAVVPLHPDRLKRYLEDRLMERSGGLLYASLPIGFDDADGEANGVIIANKSGMQLIRCTAVVDVTETAVTRSFEYGGGLSEEASPDERTGIYYRTLEFDRTEECGDRIAVPEELQIEGGVVRLIQGCRGEGHTYAVFAMRLSAGCTAEEDAQRERKARHISMRLTGYLKREVQAFHRAILTAGSYELYGPCGHQSQDEVSMGELRTERPNVYRFHRLDPAAAVSSGTQAGTLIAADLRRKSAARASGSEGGESRHIRQAQLEHGPVPSGFRSLSQLSGAEAFEVRSDWPAPSHAITRMKTNVLVVGGGTSGASAAIVAAEEGLSTTLLELNPGLGGTGTFGGVDSYWFGRRVGYANRISEAVANVHQQIGYKGGKWNIEAKAYAWESEAERAGVDVLANTIVFGALMDGNRLCGAVAATRFGVREIRADAVIDATGDGDIAAFAGATFTYGSEKDQTVMWYSLAQFKQPGRLQNNFTSMVRISDIRDYTRAILAGRRRGDDMHDHGIYIATRESRHIEGDVRMTLADQLLQRRWPDVVNIHFSNHDVKGVSGADWVNIGLIPPNLEIEIPYGMMLPRGIEGLLVIGKALSATHDALPAIRMQSDLENLGGVAALASAMAVKSGITPREIDISELQRKLEDVGLLPEGTADRKLAPYEYADSELERLVETVENKPLYEYAEMRMNEVYTQFIPFVEIAAAGERIVPYLKKALASAEGLRRIHLAQALAMYGEREAGDVLISELTASLQGKDELPRRTAEIMYVQLPPDHGAMPPEANMLYSLAQVRDPRSLTVWSDVARLLDPTEDDFKDTWKGIYYYIDAVCQGAERLGDPAAIPILEELHRIPYLHNQMCVSGIQADYFLERRSMLELAIGRALARLGSPLGYEVLIDYLPDVRVPLREQALQQLQILTGQTFEADMTIWRNWLAAHSGSLAPQPETSRLDAAANSSSLLRDIVSS